MNVKIIGCLVCICFLFACQKEASQEEDIQEIQNLEARILGMTDGILCDQASDWTYTAFGSKACGGPASYIVYPNSINTTQFLGLVEQYKQMTSDYNQQWGIISDCALVGSPTHVDCKDGKPVLVY